MGRKRAANKIVCMGSLNMDLVMYVKSLPAAGETVVTDNFSTFPGGKGGNQAATVGRLGGNAIFLGKLGSDGFSESLITSLIADGIDVSRIIRVDGTSGIAIILVDKEGQNSIAFTPGTNALLSEDDINVNQDLFQEGRILLASLEIGVEKVYYAARLARQRGMTVLIDPAPMPHTLPADFSKYVNIITPNETEASILTGIKVNSPSSAKKAVEVMFTLGYSKPIITLGAQGLVFGLDGEIHPLEAHTVNAVDTTAAGDVFAGALAMSIANGTEFTQAIKFANVSAALSTTVKGAQTSIPEMGFVEQELRKESSS